jgi:hypothetical protein
MKKIILFLIILVFTIPSEINAQKSKSKDNKKETITAVLKKSKTPKLVG